VVGDTHTLPLYGERVAASLRARGMAATTFAIPAGETTKTIETVASLWSAFLTAGIERGHAVIALGGGVVGDLTGFAAATWLRGVRWIGLPTTLLAMVDSGLGGKTGADLPQGKNLIGAFHPPSLVLADTSTLATLPAAELRCGLAEAIKHAVIGDPGLLDDLPRFAVCEPCADGDPCACLADAQWLAPFVARAMAVKIRVIQQDPFEKGVRAALNLGHTIGHGIEKATRFAVRHGEAVAIGTVLEARLAEALGIAPSGLAAQLAARFAQVGLPVTLPAGIDLDAVQAAMTLDKKKAGGKVRFALPAAIGEVRTGVTVDDDTLSAVLRHAP
jgi:3-dehydroquinate synthase